MSTLGIRPVTKGGRAPAEQEIARRTFQLGVDLIAVGPVNCTERAIACRRVHVGHNPALASLFRSLGLEF